MDADRLTSRIGNSLPTTGGREDDRQADSLSHRRERKAAIGVPQGMAKRGFALDAIMHVVTALYRQGDLIAERSKDIVGPRTESHHHFSGLD